MDTATYHADEAERLLAELRDGVAGKHGAYAPSAEVKAQAAMAHAMLAAYFREAEVA